MAVNNAGFVRPIVITVTGGRDFEDADLLEKTLNQYVSERLWSFQHADPKEVPRIFLVEGGAGGADELARKWAEKHGYARCTVPAEWKTFDKTAGSRRNEQMQLWFIPDMVFAFPGGTGTADMVARTKVRRRAFWQNGVYHPAGGAKDPEPKKFDDVEDLL